LFFLSEELIQSLKLNVDQVVSEKNELSAEVENLRSRVGQVESEKQQLHEESTRAWDELQQTKDSEIKELSYRFESSIQQLNERIRELSEDCEARYTTKIFKILSVFLKHFSAKIQWWTFNG
jgi:outer membrane murein-binding lipoprotein Lpp